MRRFIAQVWFPLALILLGVAFIPSLVLFGLTLAGYEPMVNENLEASANISYHLALPWTAGLVLFLVPVLIVLLYFLKLKRTALAVPSTFLWKKSIEDLHVNSLLQWLRRNVLLLLQLLVMLALLYAILGPRLHGQSGQGERYIVMIDNSASMSATDVSPSRLEWAKAEALKLIDAAGDNDIGMVIVFNSQAETRQLYTTNKQQLRKAVLDIEPTNRPTRIDEALALADSLANPSRSSDNAAIVPAGVEPGKERTYVAPEGTPTAVHLFSDGRFPAVPQVALGNLNVQYHAAGQVPSDDPATASANNLGIVAYNATRDDNDPSRFIVFAQILNFRHTPVERLRVQLDLRPNHQLESVQERTLKVPARRPDGSPGEAVVTFTLRDLDETKDNVLHLKLADHRDDLAADDQAWLVIGTPRKAQVLIVGPDNPILDAFFFDQSTKAVADVTRLSPKALRDNDYLRPASEGAFDLVVFDRCAPRNEDEMPRSNTFFIGALPPPWKQAEVKIERTPFIKGWNNQAGVTKGLVGLQDVAILEALRPPELPPRTPRLIEGDEGLALLFSLSRNAYTDLVQTFALVNDTGKWNTNWPLQTSFPLYLRSVLYTLGNLSESPTEETIQPGQAITIRLPPGVEQARIQPPTGPAQVVKRTSRPELTFADTDQLGVYTISLGQRTRYLAVNLLDPDESNIEPLRSVRLGSEEIEQSQQVRRQPRDLWKWLVVPALLFLMLEWYIYNRRVYV
jgi:hypothetical protein